MAYDSQYPFRFIVLGVISNQNTGHVQTEELARGRGDNPNSIITNVLRRNSYSMYDQLLLVTVGPATEQCGAALNLHTEAICVTPPPAFELQRLTRR